MKFNWKILLIALLGATVDILPTLLEDLSKEKPKPGSNPGQRVEHSSNDESLHPLQHLKRRATD